MERELHNDTGDAATIGISYPVQTGPESDEYLCTITFTTTSEKIETAAYGLGEMQAIYLGMCALDMLVRRINSKLDPANRWVWRGGMNRDDFGLPRVTDLPAENRPIQP